MAITIPEAYVETFENTVRQLAQQNMSRLRGCVTEVNKQSKAHNWDRLAASAARQKTSARMVSPAGGNGSGAVGSTDGLEWTSRSTVIETWDTGEVIEKEDIVQMMIDPKSATTANLVMNMQRGIDDIIIANVFADAATSGGSASAFPAGQIVGDYTGEITLDFCLEVQEKFDVNDVDPGEEKYMIVGPKQKRKLMQLIEVTSNDFQDKKALSSGYLPSFLGFNWIISNRLNVPQATELDCIAMTKKAMGLHVAGDITADVAARADMSFAWQVYLQMSMDCVRVEDEHIVQCKLADTIT